MLKSIKGVCRNGRVELQEPPPDGIEGEVIVTFLASETIDLRAREIDEAEAAELQRRLAAFAEDWGRPEMGVYDAP